MLSLIINDLDERSDDACVLSGSRYVDQIIRCVSCMEEKATGTMGCLGVSIVNVINLHIR